MFQRNQILILIISLIFSSALSARERVEVVERHVVTDTGQKLRGGDFRITESDSINIALPEYASNYKNYFKQTIVDSALNVVRITARYPDWDRDPRDFGKGVGSVVRWANELGIYACINLHTHYGQEIDVPAAKAFWSYFANYEVDGVKMKDNPNVIFELSNEPIDANRASRTQELYDYVRALAPDTHLILFSTSSPSLIPIRIVDQLKNIDWTNTSVSAHTYRQGNALVSEWRHMDALRNAGYPIIVTEFKSKDEINNDIEWPQLMANLQLAEYRKTSWMHWDPKLNYYNAIAGDHIYDERFKENLAQYGIPFWGSETSEVNLALNGTATQSSINWQGNATRAIDNNTDGVWTGDSITHTATEEKPWWKVDLGASYNIDDVEIWGRTDSCCQYRLSNYDVFVQNNEGEVIWSDYLSGYPNPNVSLDVGGVTGRYVMIQLRGSSDPLSLAEVKVFGSDADALVTMQKVNALGFGVDGNHGGEDGQDVYLWNYNASNVNQQWFEISRGDGYYSYKKYNTNLCLDGGDGGANAQNVYLMTCSNNDQNQHWQKVSAGGSNYRLIKRNAPGFSIDGNNGGENQQSIYLWETMENNKNQQWLFKTVN